MFDDVTRTDISKVDATTGKELAGAKLTLYDEKKNKVDEWTSTTKPHKVYGLVVGKTYRLTLHLSATPRPLTLISKSKVLTRTVRRS